MKTKIFTAFLLLSVATQVFADAIQDKIKSNEVLIESLQDTLDKMQSSGKTSEELEKLQKEIDDVIKGQNRLLETQAEQGNTKEEEKNSGRDEDASKVLSSTNNKLLEFAPADSRSINPKQLTGLTEEDVRRIIREELAKTHHSKDSSKIAPGENPHATSGRAPTAAEKSATEKAEDKAPALPEANSPAVAQYAQALEMYKKGLYKEASAGFGRIIKSYPKDQIVGKSLVHLAFSLEQQNDLKSAAIVCEAAIDKKINDAHRCDCNIIRLKYAKTSGKNKDVEDIKKMLPEDTLTEEQKNKIHEIIGEGKIKAGLKRKADSKTSAVLEPAKKK